MFPWADGDNLRDFWDRTPSQPLNPGMIRHAVAQLHGIAEALQKLHNIETDPPIYIEPIFEEPELERSRSDVPFIDVQDADGAMNDSQMDSHKISMRHGDLKPENILVFSDPEQGHSVFRIADMGLAKKHIVETNLRGKITSTMFGTRRYEPPEAGGVQSRLFDIWSMGCIVFEYIIWLLYGNAALKEFIKEIDTDQGQYYETRVGGPQTEHVVRSVVCRWMEHIRTKDSECSQKSAIRDLLEIVENKLLLVNLPPDSASSLTTGTGRLFKQPVNADSITRYRAKAVDFRDALEKVLDKTNVDGSAYLLTGKNRSGMGPPKGGSSSLSEKAALRRNEALKQDGNDAQIPPLTGIHGRNHKADYSLPPLKGWEFLIDNKFSETVAAHVEHREFWPTVPSDICAPCRKLNFLAGGFAFEAEVAPLQERSETCVLCRLIHNASKLVSGARNQRVRIERQNSKLLIASNPLPVLSIFREPNLEPPPPVQLGFPRLPIPGSSAFFSILRLWLSDCDTNHQDCHVGTKKVFPTRLIDVGTFTNSQLRLIETHEEQPTDNRYIALSHPWGDTNRYPPFNTVRKDVSGANRDVESFKERIPYEQLPATFRDTVDSTRALGIRYLWIDSICIIQGPDGDFSEEAKKMEDVYSGAFCVLAASRAKHQHDGFLKPRSQPNFATLTGPGGHRYYVCQAIDNFAEDVLEGSLNQRGWVLEERALARRTIYFTEAQTYFECGDGIRCETMTKMHK
jgi:serine/threonine protein kinase